MGQLDGKTAIVTGGTSGIGLATAQRFAAEGAHVVVADIDDERAERAAAAITDDGNDAESSIVDVAHEGEVAAMFEAIVEQHGRVDLLVCSAAAETRASAVDTTDEMWRHVLDVNLKGPFLCMKYGIPPMIATGGGSVILLGSILGSIGSPGYAAYCASKGGVVNLTRALADEYLKRGIRVNCIAPGGIETPLQNEFMHMPEGVDWKAFRKVMTPLGNSQPEEIANVAIFVASDACRYMTGSIVSVDGGLTI